MVYRAADTRLGREVAVKMLAGTPGADEQRFRAEVSTLARFSHPNLVRLLDAGESEGRLYLVMDLIEGTTVATRLASGALGQDEVAAIGAGVGAALAYVHSAGIVHRDIKPANILLGTQGVAYLADFGIARLVDTTGMTATGLLLGTPAYLAPEQLTGGAVGAPADVFALGLVLLECLTGARAFSGTVSEMAASRVLRDLDVPDELGPRWAPLLRSMTARAPERRIPASAVASRLSGWLQGPATLLLPASGTPGPTETAPVGGAWQASATGRSPRLGPRRAVVGFAGVAVLVALLLGLAAGYAVFGPSRTSAKTTDPARRSAPSLVTKKSSSARSLASRRSTPATTRPAKATSSTTAVTALRSVPTVSAAGGGLLSALAAGVADGHISPPAGQQLISQLQALLLSPRNGPPGHQAQQLDGLSQTFYRDVSAGQVTGSATISSLSSSLHQLATALGTAMPTSTTSAQAPQPAGPGAPGGNGGGNGKGNAKGPKGGPGNQDDSG